MSKWQRLKQVLLHQKFILAVYILIAAVASVQLLLLPHNFEFRGKYYTEYNNYIIFKQSFYHLLEGKDLYILYRDEQADLYKYSPAFALFMGTLAWLPDAAGLILWNVLNAVVLFAAVRMLPFKQKTISLMFWFLLIEMLTSLQNSQSNALLAGLLIAAYAFFQRGKLGWAALMLVLGTFIKVYGIVGFCMFLFYPGKLKFITYSIIWTILFAFIPLVVLSPHQLMDQYASWARMMAEDQAVSYGYSLMGFLHAWFKADSNIKNFVTIIGVFLFLAPLVRFRLYKNELYRILVLAQMLIWVVIFNHKAESPTFIIAVAGVAIWYFANGPAPWWGVLLLLTFIFTCLSPTDLFPPYVRHNILMPYVVKVIPCIVVWLIIMLQLVTMKNDRALANADA
ncbi:MAG: DUF2029 domain-containing protein [Sphingobacteriales bacterium]|nr:MAG: DUF2029 domain-containing protein [Sphingobacteriales bacterium]